MGLQARGGWKVIHETSFEMLTFGILAAWEFVFALRRTSCGREVAETAVGGFTFELFERKWKLWGTSLSREMLRCRGLKPIRWTTDACGRIGDNHMTLRAKCGKFSKVTRLEV
ncbi:MAG: hypothetical protein ACTS4U_01510 [Candidatus Hodgkinia cicadicola]